jgi:dTDP-4-amino-4,6-dideoxygalactose transaminase
MLVLRNKEDYDRAKKLRWFGIDRETKQRLSWQWKINHKMALNIEEAGYKFHMNDISAALGIVGLRHSDEILNRRKLLCETYSKNIKENTICGGAYWLFAILDDDRNKTMERLRGNDIECDLVQIRNDTFTVFGERQKLPNMDRLELKYLYLPLHPKLSVDNIKHITEILNK